MSSADNFYSEANNYECETITSTEPWDSLDDLIEYEGEDVNEDNVVENVEIENTEIVEEIYAEEEEEEMQEVISDARSEIDDEINVSKYYCYDCRTVFNDLQVAEQHDCPGINSNDDIERSIDANDDIQELEYTCAFCEQTFDSVQNLEIHQTTYCNSYVTQEAMTTNDEEVVGKEKSRSKRKIKTNQNDNGSDPTVCDICNTEFANSRALKLHMRIHKERPLLRIQAALPEAAAQKYNRLDHFFCEICNKSFDKNLLTIHKNMHQNIDNTFSCQICNRQFKNRQSLDIHNQIHADNVSTEPSTTIINPGPTKAALRNARKGITSAHLANAKQTFPCQYCGHLFWRPHEKVRHERIHTGEKPYACEVCGKCFRVPYSLTLHLRTHTNIRPYVCSTCNKRFKSHNVYAHHLRIHQVERNFECDICGKSFRTSVQLCAHKNTHTKPFNCTVCNRPFASLFVVKAHMKSHLKAKSYENAKQSVCTICGATYARSGALRAHMIEQHNIDTTVSIDLPDQTEVENNEIDEAAMLLINAAADASSRQNTPLNASFETNEVIDDEEYLKNQELLDFYTEEEVVTGF